MLQGKIQKKDCKDLKKAAMVQTTPACADSRRAVCKYLVPKPPAISGPVDAGLCRIYFPFICKYDNDARLRFIVRVVHTLKGDVIPLDSD